MELAQILWKKPYDIDVRKYSEKEIRLSLSLSLYLSPIVTSVVVDDATFTLFDFIKSSCTVPSPYHAHSLSSYLCLIITSSVRIITITIKNVVGNTHFCEGTLVRLKKLLRTLRKLASICANGVTMRSSPWLKRNKKKHN